MNAHCEVCNINIHKNSLSKHRKTKKHIQNLERTERKVILEEEDVNDQIVIPNDFLQGEDEIGRGRYIDHFRLTNDMKVKYTNRETRSHPENAYARVK